MKESFFRLRRKWLVSHHLFPQSGPWPPPQAASASTPHAGGRAAASQWRCTPRMRKAAPLKLGPSLALVLLSFIKTECLSGIKRVCLNQWPLKKKKVQPGAAQPSHCPIHYSALELNVQTKRLLSVMTVEVRIELHAKTLKSTEVPFESLWRCGCCRLIHWGPHRHSPFHAPQKHAILLSKHPQRYRRMHSIPSASFPVKKPCFFIGGFQWFQHGQSVVFSAVSLSIQLQQDDMKHSVDSWQELT